MVPVALGVAGFMVGACGGLAFVGGGVVGGKAVADSGFAVVLDAAAAGALRVSELDADAESEALGWPALVVGGEYVGAAGLRTGGGV